MGTDTGSFFEMTLTRADFLRLLPVAVGHAGFRVEGDDIVSDGGALAWRIRLEDRPARKFGPVELPVVAVTLDLTRTSPEAGRAFVERFLLGFQRAGG
ncbi:MAG: hypothetical protein IPP91_03585 [Betaproteobacteria bacterium]|nr:hypothetical protein [Betaproteobacteria bacterium]